MGISTDFQLVVGQKQFLPKMHRSLLNHLNVQMVGPLIPGIQAIKFRSTVPNNLLVFGLWGFGSLLEPPLRNQYAEITPTGSTVRLFPCFQHELLQRRSRAKLAEVFFWPFCEGW